MEVSVEEYNTTGFEPCDDNEKAQRAINRAYLLLDIVTDGLCVTTEGLDAAHQAALKRAVYAQAEQYIIYEDFYAGDYKSVEVGDYAYTTNFNGGGIGLCALAKALLSMNGLYPIRAVVR